MWTKSDLKLDLIWTKKGLKLKLKWIKSTIELGCHNKQKWVQMTQGNHKA